MDIKVYGRDIDRETSFEKIASMLIVWSAEFTHYENYLEDGHITISPFTATDHVSIRNASNKLLNRLVYRMNWIIVDDSYVPLRVIESIRDFINKRERFTTSKRKVHQWCKDELLQMEAEHNGSH